MGIIKDFQDFYKIKHNKLFATNNLFLCNLGTYEIDVETLKMKIKTKFISHGKKIMQELSPKEIKKYLKDTYGENDNLPKYHNQKTTGIRYFRIPASNVILPCLTTQQSMDALCTTSFQAVCEPIPFCTQKSIPAYLTLEEIKKIEQQANEKNNKEDDVLEVSD